MQGGPLKLLTFSTLYPSAARPGHGGFVETRLRELMARTDVQAKVVAPVAWFPSTSPRFGDYAVMARTPLREQRHGIDVLHPRYVLLPKVGMLAAPWAMAAGALPTLRRLQREGFDFDLIDAHYFYPDGVAAAILARWLNKPLTITARGSDLNLIGQYPLPRRMMQAASRQAGASIGVCRALTDVLASWGVPAQRLLVARNGVDLQRFRPMPQEEARRDLGLTEQGGPVLVTVGNLVELKGHALIIESLVGLSRQWPGIRLLIVGDGAERANLEALAMSLGVGAQVHFAGRVPNQELYRWYSAADWSILASSREGWANVLLESMACGTPVLATPVGGTPEVICSEVAGSLLPQRSVAALEAGLQTCLARDVDRLAVRAYAEDYSWDATCSDLWALFQRLSGRLTREELAHA